MPGREFTYEELDEISRKEPGMWTWPTAAMLWMLGRGLEVELVEDFDYLAFADGGEDYLIERYGEEVGRAQAANSDVEREREIAREFARKGSVERRPADLADIRSRVEDGWVVIVNLNAAALAGEQGYTGHFVVVCEAGEDAVTLHDPGLPPKPGLAVPSERFMAAWAYPTARDRNLMAIRRPSGG